MRILIIEDEPKVARALREGLEGEHYEVVAVGTGEEGFFKEYKFYAQLRAFRTANPHIAEGLIWAAVAAATLQRFMAHLTQQTHAVEISTQKTAKAASAALTDLFKALATDRTSRIQKNVQGGAELSGDQRPARSPSSGQTQRTITDWTRKCGRRGGLSTYL